ncbi:TonB-dependent receptor [Pedobacter sp. KBS0701]|uniref:TonB-dependent receptor n=1 Tax=unclassified Pedobacter TaxID=2628915 RepID=UPI00110F4ED2|nr:carboxypeptidase regulatory-like domain-containing protein [Pedobacter sp. KBS0701]QDW24301.1 TonB-dependent receptor [Pedobacter sp. KBS0701]
MKKSLLLRLVLVIVAFVSVTIGANAQVTSSSMTGTIKDAKGALPGASVKATHTPTGTVYSVSTNNDGRFVINNMRVGGPYIFEISFVGYQPEKVTGAMLKLGEPYLLNLVLSENGKQLQEVVVAGKRDAVFSSKKVGASTNVSKDQIQSLPSLSRSLQDFTRLTPQANGNSFGGINNRFNGLTIDGAVNNDAFGLGSTGAPGGQANTQPISLDAIQELQIVLAPFDVTNSNAIGGGVNAVTRSGSNTVEGSAYFFGRNQNTIGKSVDGTNAKALPFHNFTYGARVGGPIIKDKLFFFVSAERQSIVQPTTFNSGDVGAVSTAELLRIAKVAKDRYGYDAGGIDAFDAETRNDKLFARIDWNINSKNQLTLRHNYIKAYDDNISRSATSFRFASNLYRFNDQQNNSVLELRSAISSTLSNNLIVGYSRIRDTRATVGDLFPQIRINGLGTGSQSATLGSEASSTANELDQDIFEFTDNFKIFANKHTFTIGTHNEFYKIRNLFVNNLAGSYAWNNLADFESNTKPSAATSTSKIPGDPRPAARFSAAQLGFYFQDEIDAFKGFKLIAGLRVDVPLIFDTPLANPDVVATFPNYKTDQVPSGQILVSPRLSFNWDLTGDRSVQLRGGGGLLTSRAPFVWISNQFSGNGMLTSSVSAPIGTGTFIPDVNNQSAAGGVAGTTSQISLIDNNFKLPQVFRANLAVDFKLPGGVQATIEGLYSSTVNNISYKNLNIKPSVASINPALSGGADTRPLFVNTTAGRVNGAKFTEVYLLQNTRSGSAYNVTAQLQKSFDLGLYASIAYTYGKSEDINSGFSSTASSGFGGVLISRDPQNPPLAYSNYDLRHRIVGALNYSIKYGKNKASATTFSLFYVGKSGTPFSYIYNGDLNGDNSISSGNPSNDLIFVPRTLSDIKLIPLAASGSLPAQSVAEQWAALDNYISNDPYLSKIRGQYSERNVARMPWEHQFDVRIMQDLGIVFKGTKNSLQLSVDIINVGNLINKDWGRSYFINNTAYSLINYVTTSGGGFTFRAPTGGVPYAPSSFLSRWQGQVGIRYNFN